MPVSDAKNIPSNVKGMFRSSDKHELERIVNDTNHPNQSFSERQIPATAIT